MQDMDERTAQQMFEDSELLGEIYTILEEKNPNISTCLNVFIHLLAHVADQSNIGVSDKELTDAIVEARKQIRQARTTN
jgi:hypothetical protein